MIFHDEVIEFRSSRGDRIRFPKCGLESLLKGVPIGSVLGKGTSGQGEVWFIPTKCCPLEPGDGIGDFDLIVCEIVWVTSECETTL